MAAPPPPPPPPPAPSSVARPNNAKLLDSIHKGIGLKKVPEGEKNDRSTITVTAPKSGGGSTPAPLPPGSKGSSGAAPSLADALKARQQQMNKGRPGLPPPNQNVSPMGNVPKPPSQTSKPSIGDGEIKSFPPPPPPMPSDTPNKSFLPPPMPPPSSSKSMPAPPMPSGVGNKPFAPPPIQPPNSEKPFAPPPKLPPNIEKPFPPAPMLPPNVEKPHAPPPMLPGNANKPIPPPPMMSLPSNKSYSPQPPMDGQSRYPPPVFHNMKPMTGHGSLESLNGLGMKGPKQFAAPPPPPIASMPTKQPPMIPMSKPGPPPPPPNVPIGKPPLPVRLETDNKFDLKFTFVDESLFPDPQNLFRGKKHVV